MTLQFGASLTDDTRSVNYDRNTFIIQVPGLSDDGKVLKYLSLLGVEQPHHVAAFEDVLLVLLVFQKEGNLPRCLGIYDVHLLGRKRFVN